MNNNTELSGIYVGVVYKTMATKVFKVRTRNGFWQVCEHRDSDEPHTRRFIAFKFERKHWWNPYMLLDMHDSWYSYESRNGRFSDFKRKMRKQLLQCKVLTNPATSEFVYIDTPVSWVIGLGAKVFAIIQNRIWINRTTGPSVTELGAFVNSVNPKLDDTSKAITEESRRYMLTDTSPKLETSGEQVDRQLGRITEFMEKYPEHSVPNEKTIRETAAVLELLEL